MYIRINGEKQKYSESINVSDFLSNYLQGNDSKGIAIARNGVIIPRSRWGLTIIYENDDIEIVHAVQGG